MSVLGRELTAPPFSKNQRRFQDGFNSIIWLSGSRCPSTGVSRGHCRGESRRPGGATTPWGPSGPRTGSRV
eukprot:4738312-Pyramimonas_sp.AAC.1